MRGLKIGVVDAGRLGKMIRLQITNNNGIVQLMPEDVQALTLTLNLLATAAKEGREPKDARGNGAGHYHGDKFHSRKSYEPC